VVRLAIAAALGAAGLVPTTARAQVGASRARDTVPQRDAMDVLAKLLGKTLPPDTLGEPTGPVISVLPAFGANPSVGVLLGVSANATVRLPPREETNLSVFYASVNFTTKNQFNIVSRSGIFLPRNALRLEGDWRYLDTNQPTFGLGPAQPDAGRVDVDFKLLRLQESVLWQTVPSLFAGVGYVLNHYFDIRDHNAERGLPSPIVAWNGGQQVTKTTSSGVSLNLLHESRDNPVNASRGVYASGSVQFFPTWLGSDTSWQSARFELRTYHRPGGWSRGVLAFWGIGWFTFGHPPYLDLPAIGWDYANRSGRGYAQGRIRSTNLLYGEAEYRVTLTANGLFGAAAFFHLTAASDPTSGAFQSPDPGGGVGLRIKLTKESNTNITLDYGVGAQGVQGVFLGTGEAF
jgi:hypothetical protein